MLKNFIKMVIVGVAGNVAYDKLKEPAKKAFKKGKQAYKENMEDVKKEEAEQIKKAKAKTQEVRKGALGESLKRASKEFGKKVVETLDSMVDDEDGNIEKEENTSEKNKGDTE